MLGTSVPRRNGVTTYGPDPGVAPIPPGLERQFLHAHALVPRLPSTGEARTFRSPLPRDLAAALARRDERDEAIGR